MSFLDKKNIVVKSLLNQVNNLEARSNVFNNSPVEEYQKRSRLAFETKGSLSKFLFGIMNDDDRVAILKNINNLYTGLNDVRAFAESSVFFVQSQIDNFMDFKNLTQWNFKQVDNGFRKMHIYITNSIEFNLKLTLDYLSDKLDSLLHILTFSKLNPTILSPVRFTNILKTIEMSLPKNRTLPFKSNL